MHDEWISSNIHIRKLYVLRAWYEYIDHIILFYVDVPIRK